MSNTTVIITGTGIGKNGVERTWKQFGKATWFNELSRYTAGITSGAKLQEAGIKNIILLEAQEDRIGGRIHTVPIWEHNGAMEERETLFMKFWNGRCWSWRCALRNRCWYWEKVGWKFCWWATLRSSFKPSCQGSFWIFLFQNVAKPPVAVVPWAFIKSLMLPKNARVQCSLRHVM